jgi:hypothetical protein
VTFAFPTSPRRRISYSSGVRRTSIFGSFLAFVLVVGSAAFGQDQPTQPSAASSVEPLIGTWRYSGSAAHGAEIVNRAIGRTVEPMNLIVRGFAADRLRGKNQLVQRIAISRTSDGFRIVYDGSRTYQTPTNQWRVHNFQGESLRVLIRENNGSLVQMFRSDSGTRRNVYRIVGEGRMRFEVNVQSPSLPRAMSYQLTYRR